MVLLGIIVSCTGFIVWNVLYLILLKIYPDTAVRTGGLNSPLLISFLAAAAAAGYVGYRLFKRFGLRK